MIAEEIKSTVIDIQQIRAMNEAKERIDNADNIGKLAQTDAEGIFKVIGKSEDGVMTFTHKSLTNFVIKDLYLLHNVDKDENSLKMNISNVRGVDNTIEASVKIFDETKNFREALNSMHYYYKGNVTELQELKDFAVSNCLRDEVKIYRTAGFREINQEMVYITSDGALKKDGTFDETLKVDVETFKSDVRNLELVTADEIKKIKQALNEFNTPDIVYPVLGSSVAYNFTSFFNNSKDGKLHILFLTGESKCGKNDTVMKIIRPLLNIDYRIESCSNTTMANFNRSSDESCTLPIIYDEHTLRNLDPKRKDMIYTWIRSTTEHVTTKRVVRGKDERVSYNNQAPIIMLGENIPSDPSIINRCNVIFMSQRKRESKAEYYDNFMMLNDNDEILKKIGYTIKRYILEKYNQEIFEEELKILSKVLSKFRLDSREFKTFRDCVFGIHVLSNAVKHYTGETLFSDLNKIAEVIYNNIVENVTGGNESTVADYVEVLQIIDMMILDSTIREFWEYVFDDDGDIVKVDIKTIMKALGKYTKDHNIRPITMSDREFVKKLTNSNFIVEGGSSAYYKPQRLYVSHGKKAKRNVYLLKMSTCRDFDLVGLSHQVEEEPI